MDKKTLLAFFMIAIVLILMPYYMKMVAPQEQPTSSNDSLYTRPPSPISSQPEYKASRPDKTIPAPVLNTLQSRAAEKIIEIDTPLYTAKISNKNGGSIVSFVLKNYAATDSTSVQLVDNYNNNNLLFTAMSVDGVPIVLSSAWSITTQNNSLDIYDAPQSLTFTTNFTGKSISKTLTFSPNSYKVGIIFDLSNIQDQISQGVYSLSWNGGLPPTQKNLKDELFYYKAYVYQGDELSSEKLRKNKTLDGKYRGQTNWAATRNKYFLAALIPADNAVGAHLGGSYEEETPHFSFSIDQQVSSKNSFDLYLGPLEYKRVSSYGVNLEQTMSMGWSLIRPISRGVLAALTAMHKVIPNYGVVLIIFFDTY